MRQSSRVRVNWTPELHEMFMQAVTKLGENAVPTTIMQEMDVDGLTREHIGSHLQKYRALLRDGEGGHASWAVPAKEGKSPFSVVQQLGELGEISSLERSRNRSSSNISSPNLFTSWEPQRSVFLTMKRSPTSSSSSSSSSSASSHRFAGVTTSAQRPIYMDEPSSSSYHHQSSSLHPFLSSSSYSSSALIRSPSTSDNRKRQFRPWEEGGEESPSYFSSLDDDHQHEIVCPCCKRRVV